MRTVCFGLRGMATPMNHPHYGIRCTARTKRTEEQCCHPAKYFLDGHWVCGGHASKGFFAMVPETLSVEQRERMRRVLEEDYDD